MSNVFGINDEDTLASLYQAAMAARILARLEDLTVRDAENSPNFRVQSPSCIIVSTWRCLLCSINTALEWSCRSFASFLADLPRTKCSIPTISSREIILFLIRDLKESFVEVPGVAFISRLILIASNNVSVLKSLRSDLEYDLCLRYSGSGRYIRACLIVRRMSPLAVTAYIGSANPEYWWSSKTYAAASLRGVHPLELY